ncbi:delphilin-like [Dorcoceras hygrometricum]|uniref:Delphilin-like n=1 Tax=Dorcoceras hygrometricum TaxID=472368 RepID=A0A2Z7C8N8_9LAMI|nr:delphilin-like [Dorcoceras hygrometricum]
MLAMADDGMVRMFCSLVKLRLQGFLVISGSIYEAALIEFFANSTFIGGEIISTFSKQKLVISQEIFTETFHFPT